MEAKVNLTGLSQALVIAYTAVMALNYSHRQLVDDYRGVNYETLRRVGTGKAIRFSTQWFYLQLFVGIIARHYRICVQNSEDKKALQLQETLNEILLKLLLIEQ